MDSSPSPGRMVAALDQAGAALAEIAQILGRYRRELLAHGFTNDDALELCIDAQRAIIYNPEPGE